MTIFKRGYPASSAFACMCLCNAANVHNSAAQPSSHGFWQAAETADSLLLRLMMVILQCEHGKCAPFFLPDSGQKNSKIPFQISCLDVPLVGGGIFSFLMGYQFDKREFVSSIEIHIINNISLYIFQCSLISFLTHHTAWLFHRYPTCRINVIL